jgi:hypothetical protein
MEVDTGKVGITADWNFEIIWPLSSPNCDNVM